MNMRQIEYVLKIAEEKNISKAAEKLYLSQPALNQQLINLEEELGTSLFHRKRGEWKVTEAGEIFIEAGKRILDIKKDAFSRIADVANVKDMELRVGVTPMSGLQILTWAFRKFSPLYPDIRLKISQMHSHRLQKAVFSGDVNLAIGMVSSDRDTLHGEYIELCPMEMRIIMRKDDPLVSNAYMDKDGYMCINLGLFKDHSFALGNPGGTNEEIQKKVFEEAGFEPRVYYEGGNLSLRMAMVEMGLCCSFMEEFHMDKLPEDVVSFRLSSHPKITSVLIYKKGRHLSRAEKTFVDIVKRYWSEHN